MSRQLAAFLEVPSLSFQQAIQNLESLARHPNADIRLASRVMNAYQGQVSALHLDKRDSTGPEVYHALRIRLDKDEATIRRHLQIRPDTSDVSVYVRSALNVTGERPGYGLKPSSLKRLIREVPPKRLMKLLSYRSLDSMLKHESTATLVAAAQLYESATWRKRWQSLYSRLGAHDFEARELAVDTPNTERWQTFSNVVVGMHGRYVIDLKDAATVVVFPLPAQAPRYAGLLTIVLLTHALNNVQSAGTYLKLHQMQPDFGRLALSVTTGTPELRVASLQSPLSWHNLQRYVAQKASVEFASTFEPLVSSAELVWDDVEDILMRIEPSLEFWKHGRVAGWLDEGKVVSCNISDTLIGHINGIDYAERSTKYFKEALRSDLMLSYLAHGALDKKIFGDMRGQLAPEMAEL